MSTDLLRLTDENLQALYQATQIEVRRRAAKACNRLDDATIIKGNEMGKRALTVAAAGKHSICFVGPPEAGKSMFRALSLHFDVEAFEIRPCPCGYRSVVRRECTCTPAKIERWAAKWPHTDILIEVVPALEREMRSRTPGTSLAEMQAAVAKASQYTALEIDDEGATLLKVAVNELGIAPDGRQRVLAVARSIANLDQSENIRNWHLVEAINYQSPYYRRAF